MDYSGQRDCSVELFAKLLTAAPPSHTNLFVADVIFDLSDSMYVNVFAADIGVIWPHGRTSQKVHITDSQLKDLNRLCWSCSYPKHELISLIITGCTDELLFSTINQIKTNKWEANVTLTGRLNNLPLLSFEKEPTDTLDHDDIISLKTKPRRLVLWRCGSCFYWSQVFV